jgi:hypothetical protein
MNRTMKPLSRALLASAFAGAAAFAICFAATPAEAQYAPPPPEVIATLVPVYHEGHAAYWYNGYWHYRDGHGAWAYYHEEPAFLRDWRGHHANEWHHYGRR